MREILAPTLHFQIMGDSHEITNPDSVSHRIRVRIRFHLLFLPVSFEVIERRPGRRTEDAYHGGRGSDADSLCAAAQELFVG